MALPGEAPVFPDREPAGAAGVLAALSLLLNDLMQSLIAAVYPALKDSYSLSFTQVGLIPSPSS